jgi:hypothetical protein
MTGMSPQAAVTLGALLLALFLVMTAAMVWQEAKRRSRREPLVYAVNDAVDYVVSSIDAGVVDRLGKSGVRRILEWEVHYLQGLAEGKRDTDAAVVAGGHEPAVEYIANQIADRHGASYAREDIRAVLAGEAGYLATIGAVGDRVEEDPA